MDESEAPQALDEGLHLANLTPARTEQEDLKRTLEGLGRRPLVMPLIVAANVVIFLLMVSSGVSFTSPSTMDIITWGGNLSGLTLSGDWWRLGSSMFIHIGIIHIAMNMAVLWDVGKTVERFVGRLGFFLMYVVSGLLASVASLMWNEGVVSAGASGAVFGVIGCMFSLLLRDRDLLPAAMRTRLIKSSGLFIGYNVLFGATMKGIDMAAHVGGLAAGFICGLLLALSLGGKGAEGQRLRAGLVGLVGAGAVILALIILPGPANRPALVDPSAVLRSDNSAIYYTDGATRNDAKNVQRVLTTSGYFTKGHEAAIRVSKEGERFVVGLVVQNFAANNPEYEGDFLTIGSVLSAQAFDGTSVVITLLDSNLAEMQRLEPADENNPRDRSSEARQPTQ